MDEKSMGNFYIIALVAIVAIFAIIMGVISINKTSSDTLAAQAYAPLRTVVTTSTSADANIGGEMPPVQPAYYACADINGDNLVSVSDMAPLINYIFNGGQKPARSSGDVDGNCMISVSDFLYLNNYLWQNGPAPTCNTRCTSVSFTPYVANAQ